LPWIIGETSYGGTKYPTNNTTEVGHDTTQKLYADYSLQKSVDCNCKGYSWWQYQDCEVSTTTLNAQDNFMGMYYRYNDNGFTGDSEPAKPVASSFSLYSGLTPNTCSMPTNYYSVYAGSTYAKKGTVLDDNGNPIANAIVCGLSAVNYKRYSTFTDVNGKYTLNMGNGDTVASIDVTYPGYSSVFLAYPSAGSDNYTHTLKKLNYNSWAKQWSNQTNLGGTNKLNNTPNNNPDPNDWTFSDFDKFYKGDFNGDKKQDLLCVKYS
jgi:hypothetical protein